nr:hypothetical protein [Streptomyces sp. RPA4-2]QIY61161.1 hypothetical protein HEP85_05065 [Streptomyces sp. RPA4-2]
MRHPTVLGGEFDQFVDSTLAALRPARSLRAAALMPRGASCAAKASQVPSAASPA